MKKRLIDLLKLAIGLGLLYFLYTKLEDPAKLWQQIQDSNKLLLVAATVTYALAVAASGLKWGILLRAIHITVPSSRLLSYQWVAEFFNNFLPAGVGGDVMRGYALASDTHRTADATASVLIDRFLGLFVFMLSAALASMAMLVWGRPNGQPFSTEELISMRVMAVGSIMLTLALVIVLASLLSRRLKQIVDAILSFLPFSSKTMPIWQKLAAAFNAYRHEYGALLKSAGGSLLIVFLTSLQIWLIAMALDPGSISLLEVLVINPIIVLLLVAVPLSPGGLGRPSRRLFHHVLHHRRRGRPGICGRADTAICRLRCQCTRRPDLDAHRRTPRRDRTRGRRVAARTAVGCAADGPDPPTTDLALSTGITRYASTRHDPIFYRSRGPRSLHQRGRCPRF